MPNWWRLMVAEAVGTFFLVFPGAGAPMLGAALHRPVPLLDVALANGLGLAVGISATLAVSGGALNPAVTVALWALGRLRAALALLYVLAELAGAVVAALLLHWLVPGGALGAATPVPGAGVGPFDAAGIECVLTFLLVSAVLLTIVDRQAPRIAGLGVGLIVAAGVLVGGPLSGAAMNPARALGPELVSGVWRGAWAYWAGPLAGGLLAAAIYRFFLQSADPPVETTAPARGDGPAGGPGSRAGAGRA